MAQHIHEGSKVKVRARISKGKAKANAVTFVFSENGSSFSRVLAKLPDVEALQEEGWVEATCEAPEVRVDEESYLLTYQVEFDGRTIKDFPSYTVWPKAATLKVVHATDANQKMTGFRFRVLQNGEQQGEVKRITSDDGTYEFDLKPGSGFTLEAMPPYRITGWDKDTGRKRQCKGDLDFEADFVAPQAGAVKQYVNLIPPDLTVATLGQDGKGPIVRVKVGVRGDPDRKPEEKIGKEGLIVHTRIKFGPPTGGGGIEKSSRTDPNYKTEVKQELDVTAIAGPDAQQIYKGKIKLKADGTGEMKVYLGLAGGDACTIEIAGSDRFLNDNTVNADATLTFTNWRKSYYELLAPDFYLGRELTHLFVAAEGESHVDFPSAARNQLKALGDSVFIEYAWQATHVFKTSPADKDESPKGTVLTKKFLEIGANADPANILSDYTMRQLPQNMAWDKTHDGLTNYVKLCDANYYWESNGGAFPANRQRYRGDATTKKHTIPVTASYQGYFIPISGLSPDSGGTGTGSLWKPDGNEGILWKAKINPDHYKTVVDPVAGNRPPGASGATTRSITVNETNQNPAACTVEFTKTGKLGHIPQTVSATDTAALHAWLEARFAPAALRAHGNKVTITITAEGGNTRRDTRFNAVKTIIDAKLASLRASHSLAIHPGLDDAGRPRTGSLTLDNIDMATATRRNCVVQLPDANPTDPGSFVGAASATKCPVSLDTYIEVHNEALGLCEQADVLCVFHKASAAGDVCTTMHELGHSYGMAVYSGHDSPPVGMDMPKKVSENEAVNRYKTNGTKGQTYVGHDHSGSHCAYGLSDAQKAQPSYQTAPHGNAAKCVMFGSGGIVRSFCPQCIDLIRGSKITAIPVVKGS